MVIFGELIGAGSPVLADLKRAPEATEIPQCSRLFDTRSWCYGFGRAQEGTMLGITRHEFVTLLGGAAAWPLAARAQQRDRMRRVGVLMNGAATDALAQLQMKIFTEALSMAGWIEGKNISIDVRYNAADFGLARIFAAQLIGLMPDVIFAASTTNLTVLREVTSTIPIVFHSVSDPIEQGFVVSLAKPGGNITGFVAYEFSIGGKWLGLLKQAAPEVSRIAVMFNPDTSPQSNFFLRSIDAAASTLGIAVTPMLIRASTDID